MFIPSACSGASAIPVDYSSALTSSAASSSSMALAAAAPFPPPPPPPPSPNALFAASFDPSPVLIAAASTFSAVASSALTWIASHRIRATILAVVVGAPALALIQGAYFLSRYRAQYGDAPVPLVPCRGVVVATSSSSSAEEDDDAERTSSAASAAAASAVEEDWAARIGLGEMDIAAGGGLGEMDVSEIGGLYRSQGGSESNENEDSRVNDSSSQDPTTQPPLRLLVIGDSLAAGVGTSKSCAPVLPRSIASALSRDLGGRPVQWTCLGEPGASAGWIVRELEAQPDAPPTNNGESESGSETESSETESEALSKGGSNGEGDGDEDTIDGREKWNRFWRDKVDIPRRTKWFQDRLADFPPKGRHGRLLQHHPCLDSPELQGVGRYDVAVVLTGPNDLKFAVLPFMLQGEDVEFRKQSKKRGADYGDELGRIVDALVGKMKEGIGESMERVKASVEEGVERMKSTVENAMPELIKEKRTSDDRTAAAPEDEDNGSTEEEPMIASKDEEEEAVSFSNDDGGAPVVEGRPLVVLAALPARNLPVLRWLPLRWLALALLNVVEGIKRTLAQRYPAAILYVEAPSSSAMRSFEHRRGSLWEKRRTERTALSVIDRDPDECGGVTDRMRKYYDEREHEYDASDSSKRPRVRPGSAGATLLSADKLHPNDLGYDFWGRYIAEAIVDEWKSDGSGTKTR